MTSRQKIAHDLADVVWILQMRQVTGVVDQPDPCAADRFGELLGISRIDDAVGFAPNDQRRCRDAVDAVLQSAVGDRPDELAGAGLRPDEFCERVNALVGIARYAEK